MATIGPKIAVVDSELDHATYGDDVRHLMRMLQALIEPTVIAIQNDPPVGPANGDTYIVGVGTGDWAGHNNAIAYWTTADPAVPSGQWDFYAPLSGWVANITGLGAYVFNGASWAPWSIEKLCVWWPTAVAAAQKLLGFNATGGMHFAADGAGSRALCDIASSSVDTVINIKKNTVVKGTITFPVGAVNGVFANVAWDAEDDDNIELVVVDGDAQGVAITLVASRTF